MIAFHRFLIGTAILFCAGLAAWAFGAFEAAGPVGGAHPVLGAAFALAALALAYYLKNLRRFLRR